ncbi:uncharacterized protein LOC143195519 isoform X2 [Rhynchophorus ferrugineus]|uniref:uncharacterized protein LOC143195519 isoform X2 n=1 Tax=Rhynchophorus ferrugineus TaxID=354439 RepID=UPI003FCEBC78
MSTESVTATLSQTNLSKTPTNSKPTSINSSTLLTPSNLQRLPSTSSHSTISDSYGSGYNSKYFPSTDEFIILSNEKNSKKSKPTRGILKRTGSLEEFTYCKAVRENKHEIRRKSAQMYSENVAPVRKKSPSGSRSKKRRSSKVNGVSGGETDLRISNINIQFHPRTYSNTSTKSILTNSKKPSRQSSTDQSHEEARRLKRRKKIINIILGVYLFLFCISILCVVVTLTHRTTQTIQFNNSTKNLTYYTFSPTIHNGSVIFRNGKN